MAQGIPGFQPPAELINTLKNVAEENYHQYAPGIGNLNLRLLIEQRHGVKPNQLLMVQGATEGLSLVFTYLRGVLDDDFATLSFEPAYESYSRLPSIFGHKFLEFPLINDEVVDYDALADVVKKQNVRLIFLSSPGNPYGRVWSIDEVVRLLDLALNLNIYVVFDSVYEELYFNERPYIPVDRLTDKLFIVSSFSKSLCVTGWRVGYIIHHESHTKGLRAVHDYIGLCAPSVQQEALARYLAANSYGQDYMSEFRQNVVESFRLLSKSLDNLGFRIPRIDGGCFIWAKLPEDHTDGFDFAVDLYESTGVAVIPGEHFSPNKVDWIRFNVARPIDEISSASTHIAQFIRNNR